MLAIAKAEHLYLIQPDRTASRRDISHGAAEDAFVRTHERAFLDRDIIEDVNVVDFDVRVWKGNEPAPKELRAGCLTFPVYPTRRFKNHIVREHFRKALDVVGVESFCPFLECLSRVHVHLQNESFD